MYKIFFALTLIFLNIKSFCADMSGVTIDERTDGDFTGIVLFKEGSGWLGDCHHLQKPDHIKLSILEVHPDYHRKKYGSFLLKKALEAAESAGKPLYATASPTGSMSREAPQEALERLLKFYTHHGAEILAREEKSASIVFRTHLTYPGKTLTNL